MVEVYLNSPYVASTHVWLQVPFGFRGGRWTDGVLSMHGGAVPA